MANLSALAERIPARELDIRRLYARDHEFRRACEDYELAVKALRHWERVESGTVRADEYRQIAAEIVTEIETRLHAASESIRALEDSLSGSPRRQGEGIQTGRKTKQERE